MTSVMKEVLLRFSHLGIQIFENLGESDLAKCRKVTKPWLNFIDDENLPSKRIHQNWERSLQEYPCKNPQTKLLVALITGQNLMFKETFEKEKHNLKSKYDYNVIPFELALKIIYLIF